VINLYLVWIQTAILRRKETYQENTLYAQPEYKPEIIHILKVTVVPLKNMGGSILE